jgi:hypothetical protein
LPLPGRRRAIPDHPGGAPGVWSSSLVTASIDDSISMTVEIIAPARYAQPH